MARLFDGPYAVLTQTINAVDATSRDRYSPQLVFRMLAHFSGLHDPAPSDRSCKLLDRTYQTIRAALGGPVGGAHSLRVTDFIGTHSQAKTVLRAAAMVALIDALEPSGRPEIPAHMAIDTAHRLHSVELLRRHQQEEVFEDVAVPTPLFHPVAG